MSIVGIFFSILVDNWQAGKVHFNYIYGLGLLGCLGMYILLSLMTPDGVAPTCVVSILGYCLLPMCALSTVGILFSLK